MALGVSCDDDLIEFLCFYSGLGLSKFTFCCNSLQIGTPNECLI